MKTKNILYSAAAIALLAACTNEELVPVDSLKEATIDASSFTLVSGEDATTRLVSTPGYDLDGAESGSAWTFPANKWENGDAIGFTHIYPTDQRIVTNYHFTTDGGEEPATFTTSNSTIFAGDYFVYYPFNKDYADYDGIPFKMDAIQKQDASDDAIVKASEKLVENGTEANLVRFQKAGAHLDKFSIGNRITVDAKVQQSSFSLTQFTGRFYLRLFPVNQTKDIYIKRVEMTCDGDFGIGGRFNAEAGVAAPKFVANETANKLVLTFNNVADPSKADAVSGLKLALGTLEKDAVMGYMSILPGTYKNVKFDVYYTETGNLKKVSIKPTAKDIVVKSNNNYRIGMPIDANGAVEATSYEIYSESEFEAAVKKSNAMNAGTSSEAIFTLMDDIKLTKQYTLDASVPVTFNGGKSIEIVNENGKGRLEIKSKAPVVINNTLTGGLNTNPESATFDVKIGVRNATGDVIPDVTIAAVNSERLVIANIRGNLKILNAEKRGTIGQLQNRWNLTVENADVKSWLDSQDIADAVTDDKPVVSLKNVTVGGYAIISSANRAAASSIEGVTVDGDFTNKGTVNAKGTNSLAAAEDFVNTDGTFNVLEGTTTVGTVKNAGIINVVSAMIANGDVDMTTNKMVTIEDDGTFTAKKALATVTSGNINVEGKLITEGAVTLGSDLEICGIIENKATGVWTLNYKVAQRNHAHSSKVAKFQNAGEVTVNGIIATTSVEIERMPKSLYEKVDNGRLVWRGMGSMGAVNSFANLSAENCWATDFAAILNPSNTENNVCGSGTWDWSEKNIILELGSTNAYYIINFAADKSLTMKNLTIKMNGGLQTNGSGAPYTIIVKEDMKVINVAPNQKNTYITCKTKTKNLTVDGGKTTMIVKNAAENVKYTGAFVQYNDEKINFTEGAPKKITE